jgi:hypothetical protein
MCFCVDDGLIGLLILAGLWAGLIVVGAQNKHSRH